MWMLAHLPVHVLLNHFVVVLVPLTAILLILCALWPPARRRLVWLVAALAGFTLVVTPLTVKAGEWLADTPEAKDWQGPDLDRHMAAGASGVYVALVLAVAAVVLVFLHRHLDRERALRPLLHWGAVVVVIVAAVWTMYMIHRIGESGARAVWGWQFASTSQ